jgi:hypothetical protein
MNHCTALRLYGFTALRLYGETIDLGECVVNSMCRIAVGGWVVDAVEPKSPTSGAKQNRRH